MIEPLTESGITRNGVTFGYLTLADWQAFAAHFQTEQEKRPYAAVALAKAHEFEGIAYGLWLSARKNHPDITAEQAEGAAGSAEDAFDLWQAVQQRPKEGGPDGSSSVSSSGSIPAGTGAA